MFSVPKPATTEALLDQMKEAVESLKSADSIGAWFIKRRFNRILEARIMYSFTNKQEERYKIIVNEFNVFSRHGVTDSIVNDLDNPLLS